MFLLAEIAKSFVERNLSFSIKCLKNKKKKLMTYEAKLTQTFMYIQQNRLAINNWKWTWFLGGNQFISSSSSLLVGKCVMFGGNFYYASGTHCVSLGVIAGMLMPSYSDFKFDLLKACCLFIVCRHLCGQMHVWTYCSMIQCVTMQISCAM